MNRNDIKTPGEAIDYLTDCTLATVCTLACMKSRSAHEFDRQISIAQTGIILMRQFNVTPTGRAADVVRLHRGSVREWADWYDVKAKPQKLKKEAA
jgi:hypothetical protein